jgi:type II secretory pathway component GspD/PulD (secretin)
MVLLFILPLTVRGQTASKTAKEKLRTKVTISATDTPIGNILMDFAEQANIDIIKSPRVTDNVTVKLTDIPLEEALLNILAAHNYTYITTENMIRVVPLPELTDVKEPQVTRIYQITYADVEDVATAVEKFVSGKAEIGVSKGTSHIIVTDTEDKIKAVDKFIEQVDVMTSQVLVEVRIYDVTTNEGFALSPDWHVGRNAPLTADTILMGADEVTKTTIDPEITNIEVGPEDFEFTEKGTETDQGYQTWPPPAGWYDLTTRQFNDLTRSGTDFGRTETESWPGRKETEAVYDKPPLIMSNWRRKPFAGGRFDRITGGGLSFGVLNDAVDVELALNILHRQVEAKLLANPRILVLDNETADFEIVREIPFREFKQISREDPITYTEFKKVGVDLKVTPHIARNGMLRLKLEPEFSTLVNQDRKGVPTIDARRVDTIAMIKDGQTIAIGGLRKRQISKDVSKVPVLGDMPLVGGLFNSETETVQVNELVIFITTTIVPEPTLSAADSKLLDKIKFTSPEISKTRIEKGEFKSPEIEKGKALKTEVEEKAESLDIEATLDLLLKKLGPSQE